MAFVSLIGGVLLTLSQKAALSAVCFTISGALFSIVANSAVMFETGLTWAVLKARFWYRNAPCRVSISYLIKISVDGTLLLIRGHRIRTQFQPVGGVYKIRFNEVDLVSRFNALPDTRFAPDDVNRGDLRLQLKGKHIPDLISWFESGREREFLPTREFYEELVRPGIIPDSAFLYLDCSYIGRRSFGLEYDKYSNCQQLILADIYVLHLDEKQLATLRELKERADLGTVPDVRFASLKEIASGSPDGSFEIARTATWLTAFRDH